MDARTVAAFAGRGVFLRDVGVHEEKIQAKVPGRSRRRGQHERDLLHATLRDTVGSDSVGRAIPPETRTTMATEGTRAVQRNSAARFPELTVMDVPPPKTMRTSSKDRSGTEQGEIPREIPGGRAPRGMEGNGAVRGTMPYNAATVAAPPSVLEYLQVSTEFLTADGGPPRFMCPLSARPLSTVQASALPRLFFLPGIEGTGYGLCLHHKSLGRLFEVSSLHVPTADRTSFQGLVSLVEREVQEEHRRSPGRALYLMGESFGCLLALAVAARNPGLPIALLLVNSATGFPRSQIRPFLPLLPLIPDLAYAALPFALSFSLGNPVKMASSGLPIGADALQWALGVRDNLLSMLPTLPNVGALLPRETLLWKLQLLEEGSQAVEPLLPDIGCPTLICASTEDQLLPSEEEAKRLAEILKSRRRGGKGGGSSRKDSPVAVRVFNGSGHTLLLEGDLDLGTVIKGSGLYRRTAAAWGGAARPEDYVWPTVEEVVRVRNGLDGALRRLCSPVFLSTAEDGSIMRGLGGIPSDGPGPLLFVGNHQTYAPDLSIILGELLGEKGILPRGLAHPMALGLLPDGSSESVAQADVFRVFGAVPATPKAAYQLLAAGESVLLFPGGAREALKKRGEEYKLFWPQRAEFIRFAVKFGATIIPFSAVGVDDGYNYVLDSEEILRTPFLAERARELAETVPRVRADQSGPEAEQFVPPIVAPGNINRLYFLFRKPLRAADYPAALHDRRLAADLYAGVKREVEEGLAYLLERRESDPYKALLPRLLYEASWGGTRQAPTFPL